MGNLIFITIRRLDGRKMRKVISFETPEGAL